jgi:hypothetical protein
LFLTERETDIQTDRQTYGQTDIRTDRHTDRRTDMTKLIVTFLNFCECAQNVLFTYFKTLFYLSSVGKEIKYKN